MALNDTRHKRKKWTSLESEILDRWDELAFRDAHGPCSDEEFKGRTRAREGEWQVLLERAFVDDSWIVGVSVASVLSSSLWYDRMILKDYKDAEKVAHRLLAHSDYANAQRFDKANWPIWLLTAQLANGDHEGPATRLAEHVRNGPYRPGEMASLVYGSLTGFLADLSPEDAASASLCTLASCMAEAKRAPRKRISACATAMTVGELILALDLIFRPKRADGLSTPKDE